MACRGLVLLAQFHGLLADAAQLAHEFGRNGEVFDKTTCAWPRASRDLATQRKRVQEIGSALSAGEEELSVLVADFRQPTPDQLREAEQKIAQGARELVKARQCDRLMTLRAPVDGTVQQLAVHTVGGVVTLAQELLAVVPQEALEVEATVLNKDIGFVRPGQPVTVKIEGFPYTRYGYLTGKVVSVSHDAAHDEKLGLVFPARIRLDGSKTGYRRRGSEYERRHGVERGDQDGEAAGDRLPVESLAAAWWRGPARAISEPNANPGLKTKF